MTVPAGAALLLVDIQAGFDDPSWGPRCNPSLEHNVAGLLAAWRTAGWPVVHVRHASGKPTSPLRPGQPGHAFKPAAAPLPGEPVLTKTVHSAFIGTDLRKLLRATRAPGLVVCGIQTNYCVATTARMAGNLGIDAWVVADACATFPVRLLDGRTVDAQTAHDVALAEIHGEFATVVTCAQARAATTAA